MTSLFVPRILVIKTGAAGDVVRTTVLLNALPCRITWVIDPRYQGILPEHHPHLEKIVTLPNALQELSGLHFDLTLSLEEDPFCAQLAVTIPTSKLTGIYITEEGLQYTPDAGWFDMGLCSKHGLTMANGLKKQNEFPFQHWLLQMLNLPFQGEEYCIYKDPARSSQERVVGIETKVGERWPNKAWAGYPALIRQLESEGYHCKTFSHQHNIRAYLDEIASCSFLISGDTLSMHVAMAYKIPCIAIFNCTSPSEIFDYGVLQKAVSPLLHQFYYSQEFSPAAIESVTVETVYTLFRQWQLSFAAMEKE